MRYFSIILLSVLLGAGVGAAMSVAEFGTGQSLPTLAMGAGHLMRAPSGPPPNAIVKETEFDFGEMNDDDVGRHTFVIKNDGPGDLDVSAGPATCKCTVANVTHGHVPKGTTTDVVVEWKPAGNYGKFDRGVTVLTNDPRQQTITLKIHGKVFPAYRIEPSQLFVGNISGKETHEAEARLLVFGQSQVEILGHQWGTKATKEFFGLTYEPLTDAELKASEAKCGYKLRMTIRPGLPLGPVTQTLTLDTSLKTKSPIILPFYGQISPEVALFGPANFNKDKNILSLGTIPQGTRKTAMLTMFLVGQKHDDVKVKVTSVVPSDLKVTIGRASGMVGGKSSQIPIFIEVPENAKPVALMGSAPENMGQIVLECNHPDYKQLRILVEMAVTDKPARPN